MKVLISFIGTGQKAANDEKKEYEKAFYQLPNGKVIKSPLVTSVLFDYLKPDKLIVIGTPQSIWSELSHIKGLDNIETEKTYIKIFEETWEKDVNPETLKDWETLLRNKLNKEISLNMVSTSATEEIVEILYSQLPQNSEAIYLDITHAFRHFPLLAAFSLPVLKYIKGFKNFSLIYALLNRPPEESPVIFMDLPDKLISLLEAVSLTEHAGNFEKFADILGIYQLKELYLKVETNRKISNTQLRNVINKIHNLEKKSIIYKMSFHSLKTVFQEMKANYLSLRMANRAVFFAERKQFLKAYTLIFEALINTQKGSSWEERKYKLEKALKNLGNNYFEIYSIIKKLRNIMAHGDDSNLPANIEQILSDELKLIEFVKEGRKIVEKLLS